MSRGSNNALRMLSTYEPHRMRTHYSRLREGEGGAWGNAIGEQCACAGADYRYGVAVTRQERWPLPYLENEGVSRKSVG